MGTIDIRQAYDVIEGGIIELVGVDEQLAQNKYSAAVSSQLTTGTDGVSGEITSICLYAIQSSTGTATGAVQKVTGELLVLDADPANAANSASLDIAEHKTILGTAKVASTDWTTGDTGAAEAFIQVAIPFHQLQNLYFVFQQASATTVNSAASDEESILLNYWFRREK